MNRQVFYIIYVLLFCIGGFIAFFGILPFRMVFVVPLALLLVPLYGLRLDLVAKVFASFALVIVISALINGSSVRETLMFFRFILTPFAMYYLVQVAVKVQNIRKIINTSLLLGMIQLPVVLSQTLFYSQLIPFSAIGVDPIDFNFGTFYVKDDPALSMFLIGLILFLLFDTRNNYFVKNRYFKATWFTLTVFLAHSVLCHLLVIFIWGYFFLRRFSIKNIIRLGLIGAVILATFTYFKYWDTWVGDIQPVLAQVNLQEASNLDAFLIGSYSRSAAILYYLNQPLKWWGDGPSKYYDPVTRTYLLGNRGQLFAFYAEVGLIGLFMGYLILFSMTRNKLRTTAVTAMPYFVCISALTITTSVMSDASIMLMYNLFMSTNLISVRRYYARAERHLLPATESSGLSIA